MKNLKFVRGLFMTMLLILTSFLSVVQAQTHTPRFISMTGNTNAFYEYLPQGYSASGSATYPVIIFIHGVGELGSGSSSSINSLIGGGLPGLINRGQFPTSFTVNGQTHKFIVISPQFVNWPDGDQVGRIIDYVKANYRVDASRIYVTGLSMGGGVTWETAALSSNVNRIAALVPIAGASYPSQAKGRIIANANLPVWAFHNQGDPTVTVDNTNAWINSINTAPAPNPAARKTIFNVGGHDSWTQAYNPNYREDGKNIYEWMLQFTNSRGAAPAAPNRAPNLYSGDDVIITLPTNSVQLSSTANDPDGTIASYQWSYYKEWGNGTVTFSNSTAPSTMITNLSEGIYIVSLTVTDNKGATATDALKVTINPAPTAAPPVTPSTPPNVWGGDDQTITLPANSVQLTGSVTPASGSSVSSYAWSVVSGPAGSSFSSGSSINTSLNSLVAGTYIIRLKGTDSKSLSSTDDLKITVLPAPVTSVSQRYLKINLYGGSSPYDNREWNNWNIGGGQRSNVTSNSFTYSDGTSSNIRATLSQSTELVDNGGNYAGGMAPKEVLRHTSYSTQDRTLTITGLSPSSKYDFEFYGSRAANPNVFTTYGNGSLQKSVETFNNFTNKAKFTGMTPDASGTIVINLLKMTYYNYLNGFIITEGSIQSSASVGRSAAVAVATPATDVELFAVPASTQDRTALKLNNNRMGKFNLSITDYEGNVVKELTINKAQTGTTQSYISLAGLPAGKYIVIATQDHYTEAVLVTKF